MTLEAAVRLRRGDLDLDVDLSVGAGEIVAVVGPNGAGKTTLVRALAGLEALDAGAVALDGRVLDEPATGGWVPCEDRGVGVVFHDSLLFPHLSALDNVAFGLRARGRLRPGAASTARRWLDRLGVGEHADALPAALSAGQAQRVALARALAPQPRLVLLDEPLAALDAGTRPGVRATVREAVRQLGAPGVLVTHDPLDATAVADVVVVLEDGRVVQRGPVSDLAARPRSAYVARLVGVNLLRGRAAGDQVALPGGATLTVGGSAEGDVLAVVHPRAVALHRDRPGGTPRNSWAVTVASLEPAGERVRVLLDGPVDLVAEVTAAAVRDLALRPGDAVWAAVKATEVDVYPA